jgi:hypothetical protein
VPSYLAYQALHELHGAPRTGKSTLASWWARALVTGEPFLGSPVRQTGVVWITERPRTTFDPLLWQAGIHDSPQLHVLRHDDVRTIPWPLVVRAAVQVARERRARVLIVDGLARVQVLPSHGEAEHGVEHLQRALDALRPACQAGLAVLVVRDDHAAHTFAGHRADGGAAVEAAAEADISYELCRGGAGDPGGVRHLLSAGRLSAPLPAVRTLIVEPGTGCRLHEPGGADDRQPRIPPRWREIAALLPPLTRRENGVAEGLTASDLARAANMSARSVREMLRAVREAELSDQPLGELAWVETDTGRRKVTYYGRPAAPVPPPR